MFALKKILNGVARAYFSFICTLVNKIEEAQEETVYFNPIPFKKMLLRI